MVSDVWFSEPHGNHQKWIVGLVCKLLQAFTDKCYLIHLISVAKAKVTELETRLIFQIIIKLTFQVSFSINLLPLLIYLILCSNLEECKEIVSQHLQMFFERHWDMQFAPKEAQRREIVCVKPSVKCMLDVVHFIRLQKSLPMNKLVFISFNISQCLTEM